MVASATALRASLTDDATAISRAAAAMLQIDGMIVAMRRDGTLKHFNREFKRRRSAALAAGTGFMNYTAALRRFKVALIPAIQSGQALTSVFEQIFR